MATYSAGCSSVGGYGYAGNFTLYVQLSERDSSSSSNTSVVDYTVFCQSSGSGSINARHYLYFSMGSEIYRNETVNVSASSPNAYIGIASGSVTVSHDSAGNATIPFRAEISASSYGLYSSVSDTFYCANIPRYFSSTPTLSCTSVTANSATFSWTTSEACSWVQGKINSGDWFNISGNINATSGTFTLNDLAAGTTYTLTGDFQRRDSGLWAQTKPSINFTTLGYASVNQSLVSKTETSITLNWSSNSVCDYVFYQINDGTGWSERTNYGPTNGTSGTMTLTGLTPNKSYSIQIHLRKKDSQLISWYESWTTTSTYAYPYANSMPNFTIGNSLTIGIYNPLGRNVTVKMVGANNTENGSDTTTGTSMSGYNNTAWQNWLYSTIPNANSGTYKIKIIYGNHTETKTGGTYSINVNNAKPTFTTWSYQDVNSTTTTLTGNNQTIIKGYSTVRGTISTTNKATANKSATMKTYTLTINGISKSSNYSSSQEVNVGDIVPTAKAMTMYAIDSRGNSTGISQNATTYLEYFNIAINKTATTLTRTGAVGSTTTLNLTGTFWNNSFGTVTNTVKNISLQYKLTSDSSYTSMPVGTLETSGNNFTLNQELQGDLGADGFSPEKSFNVKIVVTDELSTSEYIMTLGAGEPNLAISPNGISVGKPFNESLGGMFQVNNGVTMAFRREINSSYRI